MVVGLALVSVVWWVIPGWFDEPASAPARSVLLFAGLFGAILWSAFGVVRHADALAALLGEPLGTIVLTLAVIGLEVTMIAALMLTGGGNADFGRDTMFSVLMLVLNGLVGLTLIVGGLKHREPIFNLQGANTYLSVIIPLAVLGLILPRYTTSTSDASASPLISIFLVAMCVTLYGVFLGVQTMRHRHYFTQPGEGELETVDHHHATTELRTVPYHGLLLVLTMIPVILLAKALAGLMDVGVEHLGAPQQLAGLVVATLVLTPEGVAAIQAARANQLQRGVNICLGSALATIGLTIPAVVCVGWITGLSVQLGLTPLDQLLLVLTLLCSTVTFAGNRTNILQGAVHVVLFLAWLVLIFD